MVDYEILSRLRPDALSLRDDIKFELVRGRGPYEGWLPDDREIENLFDRFLPLGGVRFGADVAGSSREDLTWHRDTSEYWRSHCLKLGDMMEALASRLGQDERLWRVAGLVHDLDFIESPHFQQGVDPQSAHPLGVCRELRRLEAPPVLILAVMEHSPHLLLPHSSPLSHALVLSDDHATMTGAGVAPEYPPEGAALAALLLEGDKVLGFFRDDMRQRAHAALAQVLAVERAARAGEHLERAFCLSGWTL